ncbi:calcium-binding protein [Microvirga roseola]|uniref:calcium-binding protein n=1 Tax=Microvirga roseola TaxID=2883126 RepID=UPI001E2B89E4|nr:hypothetical protein [Microvirga roseola]
MTRSISVSGFQKIGHPSFGNDTGHSRTASSSSGLAATLSGEASAVGDNTLADSNIYCRTFDRGAVQVAFGSAWLTAAAQSQPGEVAYASASSHVGIAGADLSLSSTTKWSGSGEYNGQSWATEVSHTSFLALNIVGWNVPLGSKETYDTVELNGPQYAPTIQGNLSTFAIDARAYGDNSYVNVDQMSLATDDFSTSATTVTAAVDSSGSGAVPILRGFRSDMIFTTNADTFVHAGGGNDFIMAGKGDDWIFGGDGNDIIFTGYGNNTVFAGKSDDAVTGMSGDDWIFGGDGRDVIGAGSGNNIVNGGNGNDVITCEAGNDVISGGLGNDVVHAGGGRNSIQLGTGSPYSDGNDIITAGGGDDLFVLHGNFGRDTLNGFSVSQGDRLVAHGGSWNIEDALEALDQGIISLSRAKFDPRDLTITFYSEAGNSVLTFDNFFQTNSQYGKAAWRTPLTEAQASAIAQDIFLEGDSAHTVSARVDYFAISDYLSLLG